MRPPVVVVLGHVDHGKTKLLDAIRKTSVMEGESGGITQHIGAYQAMVHPAGDTTGGKLITFLDTPGHEAFTAIRSRGAKVADIAILVIAADESVKPQTKEAIRIIQEAGIPFIIAINKIDREGANSAKVKQDLATENVLVEEWGGKTPVVEISAKQGTHIQELLDMVLLVAELEELRNDVTSPAEGVIIESHLDKRRGYIATALVQKGTVNVGDWITVGSIVGKIKSMEDFVGAQLPTAYPSQPILITGWPDAPDIGKTFSICTSKKAAEEQAADHHDLSPLLLFLQKSLETQDTSKKQLPIIFKSDVSSSLEAIDAALGAIKTDEVACHVLDYGVGNITEADVKTAMSTRATIFGFRVCVEQSACKLAEKEGITIATFDIIYELIERVRQEMGGLLNPEIKRTALGKLKVLALFKRDARSQILGGKVTSGKVTRGTYIDILRGQNVIKLGKLTQLQQNKEDVTEVREGLEAGMRIELAPSAPEPQVGDILEIYEEENITRSL
jgi:translation initiation factor IF-2